MATSTALSAPLPPLKKPGSLYLLVLLAGVAGFYVILLFALAATLWIFWEVILWTPAYLEHARGGGAIKLLLIVYAAVGIFAWALLRGVFAKSGGDPFGIKLDRLKPEHARVFQLTDEVARKTSADTIHEIFLTPEADLGVWEEAALYLPPGMGKRKLVLGMAALNYLTLDQLRSVLAHEYGHFSHKDTFFSRFIYRVQLSYQTLIAILSGQKIQYINPLYWMIWLYVKAYSLIAAAFSREKEFAADRFAVEAYGAPIFCQALVASHVEGTFFGHVGMRHVFNLAQEGKGLKNVYSFVSCNRKLYQRDEPANVKEVITGILKEKAGVFDSHPSLSQRLEAQGVSARVDSLIPPRAAPFPELKNQLEKEEDFSIVTEGPPSAAEALFKDSLAPMQAELSDMLAGKFVYLIRAAQQAAQS